MTRLLRPGTLPSIIPPSPKSPILSSKTAPHRSESPSSRPQHSIHHPAESPGPFRTIVSPSYQLSAPELATSPPTHDPALPHLRHHISLHQPPPHLPPLPPPPPAPQRPLTWTSRAKQQRPFVHPSTVVSPIPTNASNTPSPSAQQSSPSQSSPSSSGATFPSLPSRSQVAWITYIDKVPVATSALHYVGYQLFREYPTTPKTSGYGFG